jgi:UDP-N-acetylmuramoyl-L-alanyl-D-glutamate--2,6-diaminopimelate ligase
MQYVDAGQDFGIIVDFAHTPEAFSKVLSELRQICKGRLIAVFGCPGERDKSKRPRQGEEAAKYCDLVVLTEDDPRSEKNSDIIAQIEAGLIGKGKKLDKDYFIEPDRKKAVDFAISKAKKGDIVALLSKGDEKSIILNDGIIKPWNEIKAAKQAVAKKSN